MPRPCSRHSLSYNLNFNDIKRIARRKISFVGADNKNNLEKILKSSIRTGNPRYIIIHYQTGDSHGIKFGHWTAMIIYPLSRVINYFDSYGYYPDDQLLEIPFSYRQQTGQDRRDIGFFLYHAINHYGFTVDYNEDPLQKRSRSISTCGRYCALYLYMGLSPDLFVRTITDYMKILNLKDYDRTVLHLTNFI